MSSSKAFLSAAMLAAVLAFGVVMLGAYVRLSQAGLGCPDWPGCYGHMVVPESVQSADVQGSTSAAGGTPAGTQAVEQRKEQLPRMPGAAARPLESARAWKEMIHRYFAGSLATLILVIMVMAWMKRKEPGQPLLLPTLLFGLVIFQALLGMWTVTLLLFPPVVMGHLLGGMATFVLLVLLVLQSGGYLRSGSAGTPLMRGFAALGLAVLICQIALGGWVSSNYAAIACPDFPACQGSWWPAMDFSDGFSWHGLGPDYQGGILDGAARVAIHVAHRLGALCTFLALGAAALLFLLKGGNRELKATGGVVLALLLLQIALGVSLVELGWPLPLADLHNGTAALLLASAVTLNWAAWSGKSKT